MKIYKNISVFNESLERIRWLFDEFEDVIVCVSGGKDSTVIFNLTLLIAREKKRLPLKVFFLDQEIEWEATIEQIKKIMYNKDVEPLWFQIPFKIFNATSEINPWLFCWEKGKEDLWMRSKDPISLKENLFKNDRFHKMFKAIMQVKYPNKKIIMISGVRTEETPARFYGLTTSATYKFITWGKCLNKKLNHYTFYPIYDWSYTDIWKAINDNKWEYNVIYDKMYQYGTCISKMRVSNIHHETAIHSLFILQELEPNTYEKATQRITGLDMAGKLNKKDYFVHKLPFMFNSWKEYRDYLLKKLITNAFYKDKFEKRFNYQDKLFLENLGDTLYKYQIQAILANDWEGIKSRNMRIGIKWDKTRR